MNIGDRIKARREELGMSQLELAHKLGYGSKSTVCKVENGVHDLTQTNVVKYAKALETTPAYLMGWEIDYRILPEGFSEEIGELFVEARKDHTFMELIGRVNRMSPEQRQNLLLFVRSLQPDEHPELLRKDSQECS